MEATVKGDIENIIAFTRKLLTSFESCASVLTELEALKATKPSHEVEHRDKNFDDFKRFCRNLGSWEVAAMLDKMESLRWNPEVPRFKFGGGDWECTSLDMLYRPELVRLLTQYCDGKPPRYLVFERLNG